MRRLFVRHLSRRRWVRTHRTATRLHLKHAAVVATFSVADRTQDRHAARAPCVVRLRAAGQRVARIARTCLRPAQCTRHTGDVARHRLVGGALRMVCNAERFCDARTETGPNIFCIGVLFADVGVGSVCAGRTPVSDGLVPGAIAPRRQKRQGARGNNESNAHFWRPFPLWPPRLPQAQSR